MNTSEKSSDPLNSPADASPASRLPELLLDESASLLRSLPPSCEQSYAQFLEQLQTMSASEKQLMLNLLKRLDDESRKTEKLQTSVTTLTDLLRLLLSEFEKERAARQDLETKVSRLNSVLSELNAFVPR